ncbi:MAG TPA: hypothetical protein DEA96_06435 [Leptospiraceae bacterium]|nr:hypothetical protein [Spirochaetaceae bacterium]HBS04581.1 hypothetical protein [Leptospiraceae bacterium]
MKQPLVELNGVSVVRNGSQLLQPTTWKINPGEHWVVLGPNGSGKSTLLAILSLKLWPSAGTMRFFDTSLPGSPVFPIQRRIGIFETRDPESLAQNYPSLTILDVVLFGLTGRLPLYSTPTTPQRQQAETLLREFLRLELPLTARFSHLSSGERRRVLLIAAFAAGPELLLLDEPFESLDIAAQFSIQDLLQELLQQIRASVLVLHRLQEVPEFTTHAALLKQGQFWMSGPVERILTSENLSDTYGVSLQVNRRGNQYEWMRK